jgi:hypothetical protein
MFANFTPNIDPLVISARSFVVFSSFSLLMSKNCVYYCMFISAAVQPPINHPTSKLQHVIFITYSQAVCYEALRIIGASADIIN